VQTSRKELVREEFAVEDQAAEGNAVFWRLGQYKESDGLIALLFASRRPVRVEGEPFSFVAVHFVELLDEVFGLEPHPPPHHLGEVFTLGKEVGFLEPPRLGAEDHPACFIVEEKMGGVRILLEELVPLLGG